MHTLGCLQTQDAGQCLGHTLLADNAGLISIQHGGKVFLGVIEEQEHITSGIDSSGQHILALHPVGHTHHMGSIGNNHAIEAQFTAQQVCHNLLAQSAGHDGIGSDLGVDFLHIFGHQNVAAHDCFHTALKQGLIDVTISRHPLVMGEVVHVVGHMGITVVLAIAGEMLGAAENAVSLMQTIHISLAHGSNQLMIAAVGTGQNFFTFPVISNIDHRSESHVAAGSLDLCTGDTAHGLCVFRLPGSADLYLRGNKGTVRANAIAALLGVTGNEYRNLCILLQDPVLIQNLLTRHTVVTAAAQVVLFHQFLQILLTVACSQLPEQLANLLLISHGSDGAFDPCDVSIRQIIGLCS